MAQPIFGVRGDVYHEILLRLRDDNGDVINPDNFYPWRMSLDCLPLSIFG